jgi:RNA polymerase sigma-70 factor (ECF subfamily)
MASSKPEKLLQKAQQFNQAALGQIYDLYSDPLFGYAYKHVGDAQLAEDLVAETFRRFLQALKSGGGPKQHLQAYLYRITHNLISDTFRREPPPPLELREEHQDEEGQEPSSIVSELEEAEYVRRALKRISPEQRQVIVLRFLEGWSSLEVAQAMEKSLGAVKALQHRGLASLERILLETGDQLKEDDSG